MRPQDARHLESYLRRHAHAFGHVHALVVRAHPLDFQPDAHLQANNLKIVQDALRRRARIVYLTRNPRQSGHAACERSVAEHRTPDIRAIEKKIEAMRHWQAQWDVVFRNADVLHVTYDDLRRHNSQTVQWILDFWGCRRTLLITQR